MENGALLKLVRKRLNGDDLSPMSYARVRAAHIHRLRRMFDHDDLLSTVSTDLVTLVTLLTDLESLASAREASSDLLKPLRRIVQKIQSRSIEKKRTRAGGSKPSERYEKGDAREKFRRKDWESVTVRDLIDWWCWRYRRAFGDEDDAFLRRGALQEHDKLIKKYRRQLFGGVTERMWSFMSTTVTWWRSRLRRGESWPTGYPSLRTLLESDAFLKRWRSKAMEKELRGD